MRRLPVLRTTHSAVARVKPLQVRARNFSTTGLNPVQELQGGATSANLLTGARLDEYFARTDSSSNQSTLLTDCDRFDDRIGRPRAELSQRAIPTSRSERPLLPAPRIVTRTNSPAVRTDGSGLYFYRARYYSPAFQRFIGQDRIDFAGGSANLYAYAYNQPTVLRDPRGTIGLDPVTGAAGFILGASGAAAAVYLTNPDATAGQYATATLIGGLTGAFTGGIDGLSPLANMAVAAASGLVSDLANGLAQPPSVMNDRCPLGGAAAGAASGAIGAGVAGIGSALGLPSAAAQAAGQAVETGLDISEQPAPAGQLSPSIPASIENAGPSIENANPP